MSIEWAAGFLEGEGSFVVAPTGVYVRASSTDLDALEKLKTILGGCIYSIKKRQPHWKDAWVFQVSGSNRVKETIEKVLPHLCERRTIQANKVLETIELRQAKAQKRKQHYHKRRVEIIRLHKSGLTSQVIGSMLDTDPSYVRHQIRDWRNGKFVIKEQVA